MAAFQVAVERGGDRAGLLVDFLEHEVTVGALVGAVGRNRGNPDRAAGRLAGSVEDLHRITADLDQVAFLEVDHLLGQRHQRSCVRGQKMLANTDADDQRTARTHAPEPIRSLGIQDRQGEAALQPGQCGAQRFDEGRVPGALAMNQVADDLGVGFGFECIAVAAKFLAQGFVILDDAVVDHGDPDIGKVWVCIGRAGAAVRGPAGVCDPDRPAMLLAE